MTENEIRDRLFGTEEHKPVSNDITPTTMNKIEALEAVRFLRNSLFNTPTVNKLLDNIENYILTHDAEVIKQTLNSIYGMPDETQNIMKPLEEVEK